MLFRLRQRHPEERRQATDGEGAHDIDVLAFLGLQRLDVKCRIDVPILRRVCIPAIQRTYE